MTDWILRHPLLMANVMTRPAVTTWAYITHATLNDPFLWALSAILGVGAGRTALALRAIAERRVAK